LKQEYRSGLENPMANLALMERPEKNCHPLRACAPHHLHQSLKGLDPGGLGTILPSMTSAREGDKWKLLGNP
jgi:hypothetical protein